MTEYVSSMGIETQTFSLCFEGVSGYASAAGNHVSSPVITWGERTWQMRLYPGGMTGQNLVHGYSACTLVLASGPSCRASCEFKVGISPVMTRKVATKTFDAAQSEWGNYQMFEAYQVETGSLSYIRNDALAVSLTIKVYGEVTESTRPQSQSLKRKADGTADPDKASKAPRTVHAGIASLFTEKSLTDVTIILADKRKVQAHKLILSMRSVVLKSMFSSRMSESTSNQIVMDDYSPAAVRAFVEYLYKEALSAQCDANTCAELLGMAHKYQVGSLEDDCTERLTSDIAPSSVLDILQLAELYSSDKLRAAAFGVLRGRGRETVKSAGFFDRLEHYWAACAPTAAAPSSTGSSSSINNSVVLVGKKGGKAGKTSKSSAPKAPAAGASSSAAGGAAAVISDDSAAAAPVRIPEEVREIIRALAESSTPPSTLPSTEAANASASQPSYLPPPCQCRNCRISRGETVLGDPDDDGDDDDYGEDYDDDYEEEDEIYDDDEEDLDEFGNPMY